MVELNICTTTASSERNVSAQGIISVDLWPLVLLSVNVSPYNFQFYLCNDRLCIGKCFQTLYMVLSDPKRSQSGSKKDGARRALDRMLFILILPTHVASSL